MNKIYFIQFYQTTLYKKDDLVVLHNGFSKLWDRCADMGEIIWVDDSAELPSIQMGTIYISTSLIKHFFIAHKYAIKNPHLNIIVGGPAVLLQLKPFFNLPNFRYTDKKLDEVLFNGNFGKERWHLELPSICNDKKIMYSYSIEERPYCYWGKCSFCNVPPKNYKSRQDDCEELYLPEIAHPQEQYIWLANTSVLPLQVENLYKNLPLRDNVYYRTYMRSDHLIIPQLKKSLALYGKRNFAFLIGMEIPTTSSLKKLNKGITVDEIVEFIRMVHQYGEKIIGCFIVEFPWLTNEELIEIEQFLKRIEPYRDVFIAVSYQPLHLDEGCVLNDTYIGEKVLHDGYLKNVSYKPVLTDEQKDMNVKLLNLYKSYGYFNLNGY